MARQALITLLTVVAFGILVPWYKGFAFLDPRMVAAYGLIAVLFVAPASAESFAGIPDMSTSSILSRLGVLIGLGWGVTVIVLLTGLVTLNVAYGHGVFIKPPWELFGSVLACSLMASAAVAAASAVLARSRSPIVVKTVLRLVFLAVLLAFVFASRLPD